MVAGVVEPISSSTIFSMIRHLHLKDVATFSNLFLSLYSVILLFQNQFKLAAAVLFFNIMVLDLVDGFIARLTKTSNEFGKQLDSLTDFYGSSMIIPFFIYKAYSHSMPRLSILLAFIPLLTGVLREIKSKFGNIKKETYFIGLPRNTAGLFIVGFLCSSYFGYQWFQIAGIPILAGVSLLQLSIWPYIGNDKQLLVLPVRVKIYLYIAIAIVIASFFLNIFWDAVIILLGGYILSPLALADKQTWMEIKQQSQTVFIKSK
ncbi:MAG: CDP-diacylglycerol-serine O-phosphatidyltransferase [uncultured bacterium]|nr:MAG: CDP-diacylglycerol-serine O-phosphatidyltransferase [uncultured bacterium]